MYFNLIQQEESNLQSSNMNGLSQWVPGECLERHDRDIILNKILTGRNLYAQAWGIIIIENCMK